ncbi:zinc finger BED domain-containing protein 5-like [Palaemon carinicauda]|uniref:zinc finger BED domain-containing protein 5-like n=1 Tax=Palaemon carinicauda TaxID=392227 RepID=UPI0035B58ECF
MIDVLNVAIKVVNFIKAGVLNSLLFKLLCKEIESEHEALPFDMNKSINIIMHHDTIRALKAKLDLWKCRVQQGNAASFRNLDSGLSDSNLDSELKRQIITHLSDLKVKFIRYIPDIDDKCEAWKFTRNPFPCEVADVADEVQEEFLELKFNSTAEENFKDMDMGTFWVKYLPVYPLKSHQALWILTIFGSTYLCETAFSTSIAMKNQVQKPPER